MQIFLIIVALIFAGLTVRGINHLHKTNTKLRIDLASKTDIVTWQQIDLASKTDIVTWQQINNDTLSDLNETLKLELTRAHTMLEIVLREAYPEDESREPSNIFSINKNAPARFKSAI